MKRYIMERLRPAIEKLPEKARDVYRDAKTKAHREALSEKVMELVKKYGLTLRLGKVIDHANN